MPKLHNRATLLFLGLVLSLIFSAFATISVQAQAGENPTTCVFQPPAADRTATLSVIRQITGTGDNLTWDLTYVGLHRWTTLQWPAVDYLVDTTPIFKNGGIISWLGWDQAGGGYSIILDGAGNCQGWRQFISHLSYDPTTIYKVGQVVSGDETLGKPGCSGFEAYCTDNQGSIPPHNHVALGYYANVFSFSDGTTPLFIRGYWWIHPSRVEGLPSQTAQQDLPFETAESLAFPVEQFVANGTGNIPDVVPANTVAQQDIFVPSKILLAFMAGIALITVAVCFIGVVNSKNFRKQNGGVILTLITIFILIIVLQETVSSAIAQSISPSRDSESFTTSDEESYVTSGAENTPVAEEDVKPPQAGCSLPLSYPDSIRQWCEYIEKYSLEYDFDPLFIAAIMLQESGGDSQILSSAGAVGLLQIMPRDGIAAGFMCKNGPCFSSRPTIVELQDPEYNINYGVRMLRGLVDHYGSLRDGLMHYGPADVGYYYADKVLAIYQTYKEGR